MESPRPSDRCRLSNVSFSRPDSPLQQSSDSFVESQQCSADPSAFLGFRVPLRTQEMAMQEEKPTHKLVLDLNATTGETTRGGGLQVSSHKPMSLFDEIIAADTQDDENLMVPAGDKEEETASSEKNPRSEPKRRSESPPCTMLTSVELAWRARRQERASERTEEKEDSVTGSSEYSEDLAPRIFQDQSVEEVDIVEEAMRRGAEDGEWETEDEEIECTQPLEEVEMTGSYERVSEGEVETEVYPYFDADDLPSGTSLSLIDNADKTTSEKEEVVRDFSTKRKGTKENEQERQGTGEDDATSNVASQEFLTPRVNPSHVENPENKSADEDEPDDCVPTQPSSSGTRGEARLDLIFPFQQAGLRNDDRVMSCNGAEVDPQTKAIRSLEFSFAMPEAQENEPCFSTSLSSESTPAVKKSKAFPKGNGPIPFESSISPVYQPTSSPVKDVGIATISSDIQVTSKRSNASSRFSGEATDAKKQRTSTRSSKQTTSTPKSDKRKRAFLSPNNDVSLNESTFDDPQTPRPFVREGLRSSESTPLSTPHVRTRARTLTPVPSQRTYASRSRDLFKHKFEFCLTGFVKTGEESLKELIEGHGGKFPERLQDFLYKGNSKAVVIATPVSWRKRKFMQAVACGIPVVHTDWIKDCIEVGDVMPFEGYQVPIGYSVTTQKFECCPPKELHIFQGYVFGIARDSSQTSKSEAKDKANLMAFILKACGARAVYEDLSSKSSVQVDVVLCDEYTETCRYFNRKHQVPVKDFQWVTECMILQRMLDPKEATFEPQRVGRDNVFAASAAIGDRDNSTLKLYTGELVMAELPGSASDHYLLFNVCEILSIHVNGHKGEGPQSKRKENKEGNVMLRVGILKREPYNPELSKTSVKVLDISSSHVKRRVVAISKEDYGKLKYKDESVFYLKDDTKIGRHEHEYMT